MASRIESIKRALAEQAVQQKPKQTDAERKVSESIQKRASLIDPSKLMPGSAPAVIKKEEVVLKHPTKERPVGPGRRPSTLRHGEAAKMLEQLRAEAPKEEVKEEKVEAKETKSEEPVEETQVEHKEEKIEVLETTIAATEPSTVAAEPVKHTDKIVIFVQFDPSHGKLFVRGNGPGMSWEKGIEVDICEGQYKLEVETTASFEYKFLLNDSQWESIEGNSNHKALFGQTETVHPRF